VVRRAMRAVVRASPSLGLTPRLIIKEEYTQSCFAVQLSSLMNQI
jgi:hypothetical protein